MKQSTLVAVAATLFTLSLSAADAPELKEPKDKVSYAFGMNIANNMKKQGIEINPEAVAAGMKDMMAGKTVMNETQAQQVLMSFQQEMMAKQQEKAKVSGEKNKVEGEKFLAENKKKPGVKVLPGGVQYTVLKEGNGPMPKAAAAMPWLRFTDRMPPRMISALKAASFSAKPSTAVTKLSSSAYLMFWQPTDHGPMYSSGPSFVPLSAKP